MGHIVANKAYRDLRNRLDKYAIGAPETQALYEILKIVFSEREARIASRMPMKFATIRTLARHLKMDRAELEPILTEMAEKALVLDFTIDGETRYMLAPTMVGFFEFSMMRIRKDLDQKKLAGLFHEVVIGDPAFNESIRDMQSFPLRVVAHESSLPEGTFTEVLDYERATHVVGNAERWAVGLCYCRHVAHHNDKECTKFRMESCMSLGFGADWGIRHGLSKEISKGQALDLIAETRDAGLVHMVDNIQNNPMYLCNCCGCCCEVLQGFKKFSQAEPVFSSNFVAQIDRNACNGCAKCAKSCPAEVIDVVKEEHLVKGKKVKKLSRVDEENCIGCGVCHAACEFGALTMKPREKRRITPETTFKRILMSAIEQGKLQHLLFDETGGIGMLAANRLVGAILKLPPAKRYLMRDHIKSRFVDRIASMAKRAGIKGTDM